MPSDAPIPPFAPSRRRFLCRSGAGAAGLVAAGLALPDLARAAAGGWQAVPGTAPAPTAVAELVVTERTVPAVRETRRLTLVHAHTGERFEGPYRVGDTYIDESLAELARFMRDHRADRVHAIDPALYDLLHAVHARLDTDEPFRVLSGYRTPETNARLRKRSRGVAKFSLHMEGKAADIHLPGVGADALRREAASLGLGGVGYYPRSGFVHVDTGNVRAWRG